MSSVFAELFPGGAALSREFLRTVSRQQHLVPGRAGQSARFAHALRALGVRAGDRVAVQVEKSPEAVLLYLATLRLGAVYLPLNTAYTAAELEYFLGDAGPALFVCTPERQSDLEPLARAARGSARWSRSVPPARAR